MPFTTPVLGGTRVRAARKTRLELISRNPVDAGVYVTPWTGAPMLCRPTLHDRVLITKIATLNSLSPGAIRLAARAVAVEGLAGEQATEASRGAAAADKALMDATRHRLQVALIRQARVTPDAASAVLDPGTEVLKNLARLTNQKLATYLRQLPAWPASALDAIAEIMAPLMDTGRIPRLIRMLGQVREQITEWSVTQWRTASCAQMICSAAELGLKMAEAALAKAWLATERMVALLQIWVTAPAAIVRLATQPEWLLDGWEQACHIWNHARDDAGQYAALIELIEHVPIMPREVSEWGGNTVDLVPHRPATLEAEWRNGATAYDLIARNEQFRALAL